jgi:hypothetical protein
MTKDQLIKKIQEYFRQPNETDMLSLIGEAYNCPDLSMEDNQELFKALHKQPHTSWWGPISHCTHQNLEANIDHQGILRDCKCKDCGLYFPPNDKDQALWCIASRREKRDIWEQIKNTFYIEILDDEHERNQSYKEEV